MPEIYNAANPLYLPPGSPDSTRVAIQVDPGDGQVEVQLRQIGGDTWFTPAAAEFTVTQAGVFYLDQQNAPEMQVIATGTATFTARGVNA